MKNHTGKFCLIVSAALVVGNLFAQVPTIPAIQPAGSAASPLWGQGIEQYNSFNGSLLLSVPLHHIGGRGEAGFDLVWNLQPGWVAAYKGTPANAFLFAQPYPSTNVYGAENNAFGLGGPGAVYVRSGYTWQACSGGGWAPASSLTTVTFVLPNYGQLTLVDTATNGATLATPSNFCTTGIPNTWSATRSRGSSFRSIDGSQIQFNASSTVLEQGATAYNIGYGEATISGTLVFPNGVTYTITNSLVTSITDRNGNQTTLTYNGPITNIDWYLNVAALSSVTDSMNRTTTIIYSDSSCGGCLTVNWTGAGGTARKTQVVTGALASNFRQESGDNYSTQTIAKLFTSALLDSSNNYTPTVVSSIVLPDSTQYKFQYNEYGEVARVTLPTTGAIEYDYGPGSGTQGGYLSASGENVMIYRRLVARREYANVGPGSSNVTSTTTHSVSTTNGNTWETVQVLNSSNSVLSQTVHKMQGSPTDSLDLSATSCNTWNEGIEYETDLGTAPTETITYQYTNGGATNCISQPTALTKTTTLDDTGQVSASVLTFDSYQNVTDQKDYDWGSGAAGALLRDTSWGYLYQFMGAYAGASVNLIHLPYAEYIKNGSESQVAENDWRYDEANSGTPTNDPGIVGHSSNYGTGYITRGNVTDVYAWLSSGN